MILKKIHYPQIGRIDLLTEEDNVKQNISNTLQVQTGYSDALTGDQVNTPLSMAFFCKENIQILQNGIRAGVYKLFKWNV